MNELRNIYPVHHTDAHLKRVPQILDKWGESSKVLTLSPWDRGTKPANMTVCEMAKLMAIEGVGSRIPYDDNTYDACLCIDVLAKTSDPFGLITEIKRSLVPEGKLYIEVPFMQPLDHSDQGYFRYTPKGIKMLLSDFVIDEFGIANGPGSAMHWLSRIYKALKFDRNGDMYDLLTKAGEPNYMEAENVFAISDEWYKATDDELNMKEHAISIACSYYAIATLRGSIPDSPDKPESGIDENDLVMADAHRVVPEDEETEDTADA